MRGLRLTQIKSHGFDLNFNRYQLSEHELQFVQSKRPLLWLPGKIIHHLRTWKEASECFNILGLDYDKVDIAIYP